jgi:hypothetical protein
MASPTTDLTQSFRALAASTAFRLAKDSLIDVELRDALQLIPLGDGAVRIGDWDILSRQDGEDRHYDIRSKKTGEIVMIGIVYYETARTIVQHLNNGMGIKGMAISRFVACNEEYVRVLSDMSDYESRLEVHYDRGDYNRAIITENRLSAAERRADILREKLFSRVAYI